MRRRAGPDCGFWLALGLNLLFRAEWLLLAALLWVLHIWLGIAPFWTWVAIGVWLLIALLITLLLSAVGNMGEPEPYSGQRTSERLAKLQAEKEATMAKAANAEQKINE